MKTAEELEQVGLEVVDITDEGAFAGRRLHARNSAMQMEAMHRLATAFVERPESMLQELVNAAVELCDADSAGVSVVRENTTDESYYEWVATAGVYSNFLNASLPVYPSACTVCLARGRPQHFRVHPRFFELVGVEAASVRDGILLPWEVEETRGTIFVIAHERTEAFDGEDLRLMQVLARFAAMAVRQQRQQKKLVMQASAAAAAAMANDLAHQINNPLQALTNQLYLGARAEGGERRLALALMEDFGRLSSLVKKLLDLPRPTGAGAERLAATDEPTVAQVLGATEQQQHGGEGQTHHGEDEREPSAVGVRAVRTDAAKNQPHG